MINSPYSCLNLIEGEFLEGCVAYLNGTRSTITEALYAGNPAMPLTPTDIEAATWQLVSPDEDGRPPLLRVCARCGCWTDVDFCEVCDRMTTPGPAGEGE